MKLYSRAGKGWSLEIIQGDGKVPLSELEVELSLDEIYEDSGA